MQMKDMEDAAQPLNSVMLFNLQPAQMQTGNKHRMGELVEK